MKPDGWFPRVGREFTNETKMKADFQQEQTDMTGMKNHSLFSPFPPVKSFRFSARPEFFLGGPLIRNRSDETKGGKAYGFRR
jgi:hypothetical protein